MQEVPDLIACEECDAIHRRAALDSNEVAFCNCCGAELGRDMRSHRRRVLPLTIASLFMYVIANVFPIVEMELQGVVSQTTLIGSVLSLNSGGRPLVAFLVLVTTILFPLMQLLGLIYIFVSITRSGYHPTFNLLARMIQTLRPWVMMEVFLLGTIVAFVKLTSMATVVPGVALWAFATLAIFLASVFSFNPRYIWQMSLPEKEGEKYVSK
ncbi:MAG: paraquat-inducible protein A [Nitrosospira sp.]